MKIYTSIAILFSCTLLQLIQALPTEPTGSPTLQGRDPYAYSVTNINRKRNKIIGNALRRRQRQLTESLASLQRRDNPYYLTDGGAEMQDFPYSGMMQANTMIKTPGAFPASTGAINTAATAPVDLDNLLDEMTTLITQLLSTDNDDESTRSKEHEQEHEHEHNEDDRREEEDRKELIDLVKDLVKSVNSLFKSAGIAKKWEIDDVLDSAKEGKLYSPTMDKRSTGSMSYASAISELNKDKDFARSMKAQGHKEEGGDGGTEGDSRHAKQKDEQAGDNSKGGDEGGREGGDGGTEGDRQHAKQNDKQAGDNSKGGGEGGREGGDGGTEGDSRHAKQKDEQAGDNSKGGGEGGREGGDGGTEGDRQHAKQNDKQAGDNSKGGGEGGREGGDGGTEGDKQHHQRQSQEASVDKSQLNPSAAKVKRSAEGGINEKVRSTVRQINIIIKRLNSLASNMDGNQGGAMSGLTAKAKALVAATTKQSQSATAQPN